MPPRDTSIESGSLSPSRITARDVIMRPLALTTTPDALLAFAPNQAVTKPMAGPFACASWARFAPKALTFASSCATSVACACATVSRFWRLSRVWAARPDLALPVLPSSALSRSISAADALRTLSAAACCCATARCARCKEFSSSVERWLAASRARVRLSTSAVLPPVASAVARRPRSCSSSAVTIKRSESLTLSCAATCASRAASATCETRVCIRL